MRGMTPFEIILNAEANDEKHFRRVIWITLLGAAMLGFAIGFVTGFLLNWWS